MTNIHIVINLGKQTMKLFDRDVLIKAYQISTAKNGPGELIDSECTPRGEHIIAEKIGEGCKSGTIFVGRQPTGEIYHKKLKEEFPERDWILTRILWLKGTEKNRNLGGNVDSYQRYIYIHGAPDDVDMGVPGSRGCIRMHNDDVIELFDQVDTGIKVLIIEH